MIDIDAVAVEAKVWRRRLHETPELQFDLPVTSSFVADTLRAMGCDEVASGIARSGVVAVINGTGPGKTIGLRADMDALPMSEETNLTYASKVPNRMHACGHDGHTAMLLGAAKCLTQARDFPGRAVLIFQPAEEGGGGADVMIKEGLFERFGIDEVYGMHNEPGLGIGSFAIRSGPFMAAADRFIVSVRGKGGHAASPHFTRDPVIVCNHMVSALQTIASRYTDPFDPVVVSVTFIEAGNDLALNVIPASVRLGGTVRCMNAKTRALVEERLRSIVQSTAALFEVDVDISWLAGYPVLINDPDMSVEAFDAATKATVDGVVKDNFEQSMGAEDFAYMLQQRPGAMILIGNGDSAYLHHPSYDFDDRAIPYGIRYWLSIVAQRASPTV